MLDDFLYWRGYVQHLIILGLFAFAIWRGASPERYASATLTGMVVLDYAYHFVAPAGVLLGEADAGHVVIDLAGLAALGVIAIFANRIYPLWMLAAQIIVASMHLNKELVPAIDSIAYMILISGPSYIQVLALALGLVVHRRRVRRFGTYRSWRTC